MIDIEMTPIEEIFIKFANRHPANPRYRWKRFVYDQYVAIESSSSQKISRAPTANLMPDDYDYYF